MSLSVSMKDKNGLHTLETGNISKYGLFLVTKEPKPQRQLIQLVIEFPDHGEKIQALAQVMWLDKTGESGRSGGLPGMGVKFFSLPDSDRQKWEKFVEMVRTGKFESNLSDTPPALPTENQQNEAGGVISIGEEELEELEDLDLNAMSGEIDEVILDIEEEPALPNRVEDLSEFEEAYESGDSGQFMTNDTEKERRTYTRKPVTFMVKMKDMSSMREMLTKDISLGGMFIKTKENKKSGEQVKIIILHPWTGQEFDLDAEVKRVDRNQDGTTLGLGVEFLEMDDDMRDSLLTYVESGFKITKSDPDSPIEADVIRRIEETEEQIQANPIDSKMHFELGLLYLCLADETKANEHISIAQKLGYNIPSEVIKVLASAV